MNAARRSRSFEKKVRAAWSRRSTSTPSGSGVSGSLSPIGHGVDDASGKVLATLRGVKTGLSVSGRRITQPWSPK